MTKQDFINFLLNFCGVKEVLEWDPDAQVNYSFVTSGGDYEEGDLLPSFTRETLARVLFMEEVMARVSVDSTVWVRRWPELNRWGKPENFCITSRIFVEEGTDG